MPRPGWPLLIPARTDYPLTGSVCRDLLIAEQRAWPAPALEDRIELGAVHRQLGAEMQPGQDAEDQREGAVGVARLLDVADVEAAEQLQRGPHNTRGDRAWNQLAPGRRCRAQEVERDQEHEDVDEEGEDHAKHLQHRPTAQAARDDPRRTGCDHEQQTDGGQHREASEPFPCKVGALLLWDLPHVIERRGHRSCHTEARPQRQCDSRHQCQRAAMQPLVLRGTGRSPETVRALSRLRTP